MMRAWMLAAVGAAFLLGPAPALATGEAPAAVGHETEAAEAHGAAQGHEAVEGHEAAGGHHGGHWSIGSVFVPESLPGRFGQFLWDLSPESMVLDRSLIGQEPIDSLTHVFFATLAFLLVLVLMGISAWQMKARPDDLLPRRTFSPLAIFEVLTDALLGLMEGLLGRERALYFLPLIGSFGLFILFNNLLGLIPGFLPSTSNLNTTFALGSVVFFATHYYGVRAHGIGYFKHFLGPIIKWYALPLMILMFCIEMISHVARPVSLGIRLFGNLFGDHSALAAFLGVGVFGWFLIPLIPLPLGVLVCVVQAMVFCILSVVYIHLATEEAEEGEEGHH